MTWDMNRAAAIEARELQARSGLSIRRTTMTSQRCYDDGQPSILAAERRLAINGETWDVWEDTRAGVVRSLIFESTRIARRIYGYPTDWVSLPDGELYALSWSR